MAIGGGSAGARHAQGGKQTARVARGGRASTVLWTHPTLYNERWQQVGPNERLIAVWFIAPNLPDGTEGPEPSIMTQQQLKERLLQIVGGPQHLTKRRLSAHQSEIAEFLHETPGGFKLYSRQFGFGQPVLRLETTKPQRVLPEHVRFKGF